MRVGAADRQRPTSDFSSEFDEMSLGRVAVELDAHGQEVGVRARVIAQRIGLPADLVACCRARRERCTTSGKSDARFQRWLDPERLRNVLLAKSSTPRHRWEAARAVAGWPRGGRHEDLSARLVRAWLEQDLDWDGSEYYDLLVHLVISHHGKGSATRAASP